jgi:hypothetical protein
MAKLKLPSFDGGTLLQRTLIYVVGFVLGSAGFVAIASILVVWAAKSMIPSRSDSSASAADKVAEVAPGSPGKPLSKRSRSNKGKTVAAQEDVAPAEETH